MYDSNDNQYHNGQNPFANRPRRASSPMGVASIACSVIGLICIMTGVFAVVFGSLGILFSRLSRGSGPRLSRSARYGRVIGLIAAIGGAALILYSLNFVVNQFGSVENFYNTYLDAIEQTYELDLDDGEAL